MRPPSSVVAPRRSVPLTRVLAVLLAIVTGGFATALYILLWITLPER